MQRQAAMTLKEIERIQAALTLGTATMDDLRTATDEAIRFHHKVSELQKMLIVIQKKCEFELKEIEEGKPVTSTHFSLVLDFVLDLIAESRHIKAA